MNRYGKLIDELLTLDKTLSERDVPVDNQMESVLMICKHLDAVEDRLYHLTDAVNKLSEITAENI